MLSERDVQGIMIPPKSFARGIFKVSFSAPESADIHLEQPGTARARIDLRIIGDANNGMRCIRCMEDDILIARLEALSYFLLT